MPKPLGLRIAGTGHCVPARIYDNAHFAQYLDTSNEWILERTGIRERHVAEEGETTVMLAEKASRRALEAAGLTPADLDMIFFATVTPDTILPSAACQLQEALGCRPIAAIDISAACSGFMYGLNLAAPLLQNDTYKHILVIGAETLSRITDYQDRTTCFLFGDGAGAAVLSAQPDASGSALLSGRMHADGQGGSLLWMPAGGSKLPASAMTVNERLHFMKMKGRELFKVAVKRMLECVNDTLADAGVKPQDLAMVIPHQSNLRIIEATRERLGLPPERMYVNIDRMGNTSAASVPIAMDEICRAGGLRRGDLVLLIAFGAGVTWASALLRW